MLQLLGGYYCVGDTGENIMGPQSSVYKLSEGESYWTKVNNMNHRRAYHACTVLDNYIYVLGGHEAMLNVESLDVSTMTWESLPDLSFHLSGGQAFTYQSSVYVVEEYRNGTVARLNETNQWDVITELKSLKDSNVFTTPIITTAEILGC